MVTTTTEPTVGATALVKAEQAQGKPELLPLLQRTTRKRASLLKFLMFAFRFIEGPNALDYFVKMRNVLGDRQARECGAGRLVGDVSCDDTNDLSAVSGVKKDNGATADPIDSHAVDEIGTPVLSASTDNSGEKTQLRGCNGRIPEPADLNPNIEGLVPWEECYRRLWEIKMRFLKQNHC